jgi:DNA-binding MarR family transcriptional regulator
MAGKSMRELSEWDELKTFFDRRLIKALGHPVREHILAVLNERIASAREIGEELGADVSSFYHHIEELEKFECIERVATKQRREQVSTSSGRRPRCSSMTQLGSGSPAA